MKDRFWIRGPDEVRRALRVLAAQLGTPHEQLGGILLADAIKRADIDALRKVVPKRDK